MIYVIQYLRALASLFVLLAHIRMKSSEVGEDLFAGFRIGYFGVDIFFVISGFVMCFIYAKAGAGFKEILPFWLKRVSRILPLYWVLTLLALAVFLVAPDKVNSSGGETSVWRSFLLLPGGGKFLIQNGWTLSYEFLFYAFFTLSFVLERKWLGAVLVGLVISFFSILGRAGVITDAFLANPIIMEFSLGMLAYHLFANVPATLFFYGGLLALALSIGGFVALNVFPDVHEQRWWRAGIPSFLLVVGSLSLEKLARRVPSMLLIALGDSSYSLYLFHPFLLAFAGIIFRKIHLISYWRGLELVYWAIVFIITLSLSYVVHTWLEKPLIRFSHRLTGTSGKSSTVT